MSTPATHCDRFVRLNSRTGAVAIDRDALPNAAASVLFGPGVALAAFPAEVKRISEGRPIMLVAGASSSRTPAIAQAVAALAEVASPACTYMVEGISDATVIARGIQLAADYDVGTVAIIGGGTTIDVGKAIAALVRQAGALPASADAVLSFTAGELKINPAAALSWCAMPTTTGTGSESTWNSVLEEGDVKLSLKGVPPASLIAADPDLLRGLAPRPRNIAVADALSQALEVVCSGHTSEPAVELALCAVKQLSAGIASMELDPDGSRGHLAWGSLLMGIAFAHGRLGLPHALAHYCVKYGMSHGNMVGALTGPSLRVQSIDAGVRARLERLESILNVQDCAEWAGGLIGGLLSSAGLPATLAEAGLATPDFEWIVPREMELGPQIGVPPRPATPDELMEALEGSR